MNYWSPRICRVAVTVDYSKHFNKEPAVVAALAQKHGVTHIYGGIWRGADKYDHAYKTEDVEAAEAFAHEAWAQGFDVEMMWPTKRRRD